VTPPPLPTLAVSTLEERRSLILLCLPMTGLLVVVPLVLLVVGCLFASCGDGGTGVVFFWLGKVDGELGGSLIPA